MADTLSCQFDDGPALVHSIAHSLTDVDLSELAAEQPLLEDEPVTSLKLERVSFPGVNRPVVCDTSTGKPRVLVPTARRKQIFNAVHSLAHPSGKMTFSILSKTYVWQDMQRDVLRLAKSCPACSTVLPIPVPPTRFKHVHVDLVGPFPPDRGFKYLFKLMDRTTRWPEAILLADTKTETVLQAFLDGWVSRFGVPGIVTSDRGPQFTLEVWRKALGQLGIQVAATTAYHPQANSLLKRFPPHFEKMPLRCAVRSSTSWSRSLPWVLLGIQNAPKVGHSHFYHGGYLRDTSESSRPIF